MTDINKIGEEVAALIKGAEKDKAKIAPKLREVWTALEAKTEVNGVKSKGAWAKKFGITLRYCQYIVKDGSRKRERSEPSVRPAFKMTYLDFHYYNRRKEEKSLTMLVDFEVGSSRDSVVKLSVRVPGENVRENYDAAVEKMTKLLKQVRLWNEETATYIKEGLEEFFADVEIKPTPAPKVKKPKATKKKKTHALGTMVSDEIGWTICGKTIHMAEPGEIVIADDDKKPTCKTCVNHRKYRFGQQAKKNRAEQAKQAQVTVVISDNCPTPENVAPEVVEALKRRRSLIAVGFEDGRLPADGVGEEPTEEAEEQL
jgi:hypothetical protein